MSRLEFEPRSHTYTLDGEPVPSVTTILEAEGLVDYSYAPALAMERGSEVHKAIHFELERATTGGISAESRERLESRGWLHYVESALCALDELGAVTFRSEQFVFHSALRYAGRLDWLGFFRDRRDDAVIIDFKSTSHIQPGMGLQLAAYADAWEAMNPGARVAARYVLRLHPNLPRGYSLEEFKNRDDRATWRAAVVVHHWKRARGLASAKQTEGGF